MSSKKQLAENDDVSALSPDGDEELEVWQFWKFCTIALPQLGVQVLWIFDDMILVTRHTYTY